MNPEVVTERVLQKVRELRTEVDCSIEHGAESGGHLEYVRSKLDSILYPDTAPFDLDKSGRPHGF